MVAKIALSPWRLCDRSTAPMRFSTPIDRYQLVKIDRERFTRWQELPAGYSFASDIDRDAERALLQSEFPLWEVPFHRQLPNMRHDGVVCVAHEGKPVAIAYFCEDNEAGLEGYLQVHYAVVSPEHRGRKLLASIVTEGFRRRPEAKGGIFYVDRYGHLTVYERWGGQLLGEKGKPIVGSRLERLLRRPVWLSRVLLRRMASGRGARH